MRDAVLVPRSVLAALFAGWDRGVWVRGGHSWADAPPALAARDALFRLLHSDDPSTGGDVPPSDAQPTQNSTTERGKPAPLTSPGGAPAAPASVDSQDTFTEAWSALSGQAIDLSATKVYPRGGEPVGTDRELEEGRY